MKIYDADRAVLLVCGVFVAAALVAFIAGW